MPTAAVLAVNETVMSLPMFSREGIINTMSYIKQLKSRGIWLRSMTESWLDTSQEGMAEVILAIMSWAAAEERKKISERTKAGIAKRRAIGQCEPSRSRVRPRHHVRAESTAHIPRGTNR